MSVLIATDGLRANHSPHDQRVEPDAAGTGRSAGAESPAGLGAAVLVDVHAAVGHENAASAASDVGDLAAASTLVHQLAARLAAQPPGAPPAHRAPSPQAVLSLLG